MKFDKNKIYILDGALGTELQRRGYETKLPLWSAKALFDCPDMVKQIHKDYILAGADIIITNTFRTQRRTLKKVGLEKETKRINDLAIDLAAQAVKEAKVNRKIYIAGSLTTLEDCYNPKFVPENKSLKIEHTEQVELLAQTGVDFLLLETFSLIRDVKIAAEAADKIKKPLAISFVINQDGNLLSGESLEQAVKELNKYSPLFYSINCVRPEVATKGVEILKNCTDLPLAVYANGDGEAGSEMGWRFNEDNRLKTYIDYCKKWKDMGVNIIGGCCGTNPEYTKIYSKVL